MWDGGSKKEAQGGGPPWCRLLTMLPNSLVLILLIKLVAASSSNVDFIFDGFSGANLSLTGLADITSSGLLRLTNDTKEGLGHAFYPVPLHFKNSSTGKPVSFSTTFVFAIVPQYPDVCGHGIAFALSPSKELPGSMNSQYLGLLNGTDNGNSTNHIVAIELDTVRSMDFDDINDNHVGIDVNSLKSINSSPAGYFDDKNGAFKSLKLESGDSMQVWIDYDSSGIQLDVTIAPLGMSKPNQSLVSSKVNLSSYVLDDVYVGFSASNGAASSFQYILGWSFSINGQAQSLDPSKLPPVPHQVTAKSKSLLLPIALSLAAVIFVLLSIPLTILILRSRKKYEELLEDWEVEYGPHRFSYKDLFKATKGFKEENLIGAGGFGRVYKGILPTSNLEIAVKKISHDSRQGMREFIAEIVSMGRLRHRNLVQLLGYCRRHGELLLVYDFMANGSLDNYLFAQGNTILSWSERFRTIKGVASGLLYLHEGWEQVVIHRDIKAGNVLLDAEFNAKLGDFGLARLYDHGSNPQTTRVVGTLGYLAPELSKTGKATTKTDVYAFGAFLLEVACGKRPTVLCESTEEPGLLDLVLACWKRGAILEAADPRLGGDFVTEEMDMVLRLGLFCSHPEPMSRPNMRQVMQFLEDGAPLPVITPESLDACAAALRYDESFDDLVISYAFTTDTTLLVDSSSNSRTHKL